MTVGNMKRPVVILQQPQSLDPKLELLNRIFCANKTTDWMKSTTTIVPPVEKYEEESGLDSEEDENQPLMQSDDAGHGDDAKEEENCQTPTQDIHDHYKSIIRQISISNANLVRENQNLTSRVQNFERLLRDHVDHLNSVYYTLFHNGVSALRFPDGEEVHLSQFRGVLLNFVEKNDSPKVRLQKPISKFPTNIIHNNDRRLNEKTSDLSSDSSLSSMSVDQEREELRNSLIKSITTSKYNDIDDFVNWLNEPRISTRRTMEESTGSSSSTMSGTNEYLKTRSLEEHTQDTLRLRSPLQRSPRIERDYLSLRARSDSDLFPDEHNANQMGQQQEATSPMPISARPSPVPQQKNKNNRNRSQSIAPNKANGLFSSRRTSSSVTPRTERHGRKSLANLTTMRFSAVQKRAPNVNLI